MSKRNWVCFDCRTVVRAEPYSRSVVPCSTCSRPRVNLGYKIPIPPKARRKDWEQLREGYFGTLRQANRELAKRRVQEKHRLEKRIATLSNRPKNNGRARALTLLRKRMENMDA